MKKHLITVAYGDGIGPEIMEATLRILEAGGAALEIDVIEIGEKVYLGGHPTGIPDHAWESIKKSRVFLKGPITTPQGGGYRSLNVTVRSRLGLYANIRPCVSYHPFIFTKHPQMDVVIVRENEEDLYTGVEYQQTPDVCHAIKMISRPGSERVIHYAFDYAREHKRKKVTCFTKDNILKLTDGLFHKIFEAIGSEYPEFEKEHWIIDIGSAKLADTPEAFDVLVLPNLYGDILSDVAAQITGSVGLGGSANIGKNGAMFEAIHGSAPKRAGLNSANPSGLLHAAIMMLVHIQQPESATQIHNAWLKTIEDGIHTYDIFRKGVSKECVGTKEFADAVILRMGLKPSILKAVYYPPNEKTGVSHHKSFVAPPSGERSCVGVDISFYHTDSVSALAEKLQGMTGREFKLAGISNRGAQVWPNGSSDTLCIDQYRARFLGHTSVSNDQIASLYSRCTASGLDVIKTENLYTFDGKPAYGS